MRNNLLDVHMITHRWFWAKGEMRAYMFTKFDPLTYIGHLFSDYLIVSIKHNMTSFENINVIGLDFSTFRIRAVDTHDSYGILIGYNHRSLYIAKLIHLDTLSIISSIEINDGYPQKIPNLFFYNSDSDLSISINPNGQVAVVGLPRANKIVFLKINRSDLFYQNWTIEITNRIVVSSSYAGFGRSVAWIDNVHLAVVVLNVPGSKSQMWFYNIEQSLSKPVFAYPNNQQIIQMFEAPLFFHLIFWSNNLFIVTNGENNLLIPACPPGFVSVWPTNTVDHYIISYRSEECIGGTYKKPI